MDWTDRGYILNVRPHGETSAIVNIFTKERGRCAGLVRGGRSRRLRPILQPGNFVHAKWQARLSEHLGNFTLEPIDAQASILMQDRLALAGLNAMSSLLSTTLPEREPHPSLYEVFEIVLRNLTEFSVWPALYIRFELGLLQALGYGLDLETCAATGSTEDLTHVSPRSGRAVSAEAAAPYRDKLLVLPKFLTGGGDIGYEDLANGLDLTGYFLQTRVYYATHQDLPAARQDLIGMLKGNGVLKRH